MGGYALWELSGSITIIKGGGMIMFGLKERKTFS